MGTGRRPPEAVTLLVVRTISVVEGGAITEKAVRVWPVNRE